MQSKSTSLNRLRGRKRMVTWIFFLLAVSICFHSKALADSPIAPTFAAPVSYPVDNFAAQGGTVKILAADFNNDGKPDLVVNPGGNPVYVYLNNGSGGFGSPISISVEPYGFAETIGVADFNNDGNQDLIIGSANVLIIHYGDGAGHFNDTWGVEITYANCQMDLDVGDFNHDGKPDVFINDCATDYLLLGDGFALNQSWSQRLGANNWGVALADFNGDGNLDLLAANNGSLQFGDGMGHVTSDPFGRPTPTDSTVGNYSVECYATADFNGDGKADIATPYVSIFLGDGAGGFAPGVHYDNGIGRNVWDVKVADINGDSKLDLVTIGDDKVSVLLGNGDGTFAGTYTFSGVGSAMNGRIAIADFNGDGKPDIAALAATAVDPNDPLGAEDNPRISVLLNTTYQTAAGTNSTVVVNSTTFTFDDVTAGGTTSVIPIDPASVGQVPGGFAVSDSVAYEIATTAKFTGSVTLAFKVPGPISQEDFNTLAILHNVNGTLVDVTASTPPRDYATLTIYATTTSFSPFYLARRGPHIKSLFDQTKAYKRGSTIPVKLQVLNASNANVSSSNTSLLTRDLRLLSGNTLAPIEDSGNANPDYTFRYDPTLGGSGGGYIFNLSTKGLASGQYVLSFYVGNDRSFFYTVKFEVK